MKFSESWLRRFCDPALSTTQLADALTMAGLEVEQVLPAAPAFKGVVVGEILEVERHPDAERLRVCKVDVGTGAPLSIVCGAPNAAPGLKVPCAIVGAQLPGIQIRAAKLRGVESQGMLCSAAELGVSEDASGLWTLPADAPTGDDLRRYCDLDDRIFTLKLTSNRGDCLSLLGIAREVSAITGSPLALPTLKSLPAKHGDAIPVKLVAPTACPRYAGRIVRGIDPRAPTPVEIVRRLERSGVRPISAIVDLTNYVMLELGQPMHAFDFDKLQGGIEVRFARAGERLELLNGRTVDLQPDLLVICDQGGPVALAGIMGGESTAVSDSTANVFLESAFFHPKAVAGRWRRLGFSTDASHRFERGVDYQGTVRAIERLTQLIIEVCGGEPGPITDVQEELPQRQEVRIRVSRCQKVLGFPVDARKVGDALKRLQLPARSDGDAFLVSPPSYRFDIAIEEDLIEEVVRVDGYDKLPASLPLARTGMLPAPENRRDGFRARQLMVARDYQEVITYSFVDAAWEQDFAGNAAPIRLANPIAAQMSVMRSTLLGSLVDSLRFNLNRRQTRVRLFELSRIFLPAGDGFHQPQRLGAVAFGPAIPEQWGEATRNVDYFDVLADVEALLAPRSAQFQPCTHPALHPGKCAEILLDGRPVGWIGELHPQLLGKYDVAGAVVAFEIELEAIGARSLPAYQEVSKFPPVLRDIAVIVDAGVPVATLLDALRRHKATFVEHVAVFDVYRGKGIEEGKKGLAFRVLLQDTQKTLTEAEVDAAVADLRQVLVQEYGAKLRQ
jgi:phenylalanyl-tRNA synthetase beta chain